MNRKLNLADQTVLNAIEAVQHLNREIRSGFTMATYGIERTDLVDVHPEDIAGLVSLLECVGTHCAQLVVKINRTWETPLVQV